MKIIEKIETHISTIEIYEDYVIKTCHTNKYAFSNNWFKHYSFLQENNPAMIEVYEVLSDQTCVMERLHVEENFEKIFVNPEDYPWFNKSLMLDVAVVTYKMWSQCLEYSKKLPGDDCFIHTDPNLFNMVWTKNKQIKLLDPDSWAYTTKMKYSEKFYMMQTQLMYNMLRFFYKENQCIDIQI